VAGLRSVTCWWYTAVCCAMIDSSRPKYKTPAAGCWIWICNVLYSTNYGAHRRTVLLPYVCPHRNWYSTRVRYRSRSSSRRFIFGTGTVYHSTAYCCVPTGYETQPSHRYSSLMGHRHAVISHRSRRLVTMLLCRGLASFMCRASRSITTATIVEFHFVQKQLPVFTRSQEMMLKVEV